MVLRELYKNGSLAPSLGHFCILPTTGSIRSTCQRLYWYYVYQVPPILKTSVEAWGGDDMRLPILQYTRYTLVPGRYPKSKTSKLFLQEDFTLTPYSLLPPYSYSNVVAGLSLKNNRNLYKERQRTQLMLFLFLIFRLFS